MIGRPRDHVTSRQPDHVTRRPLDYTTDLSVIVVSWNVRDLLARCLASVQAGLAGSDFDAEIVVVDNASSDGSVAMVREAFPDVRLVALDENRGYSGGVNTGLEVTDGEFVLVLNPDTEAVGDAVVRLVDFLRTHPAVGAVGPALFYPDSTRQSSRRRFHPLPVLFFEDTSLDPVVGPWKRRFTVADRSPDDAQPVDWVVGAVLCLRRAVVETVGGMDDTFFMYFEEVDWQRRIKDAGWSIWYLPDAVFRHHEGASSGQVVAQRHLRYARSRIRYARRWHSPHIAGLLAVWLRLHFRWQLVLEWVKLRLRHKPEMRLERISAYREVLEQL